MLHVFVFLILDSSVDHEIEFDDKPTQKTEQQNEDGKYRRCLHARLNALMFAYFLKSKPA